MKSFSEVKLGDQIEALFDQDENWYRAEVTQMDESRRVIDVYFLDYGNLEHISESALKNNVLRRRDHTESDRELFSIDFQAIRCFYFSRMTGKRESTVTLADNLGAIDPDKGFNIRVENMKIEKSATTPVIYGVDIIAEKKSTAGSTASDREVRKIMESVPSTSRSADPANQVSFKSPAEQSTPHLSQPKSSQYSAFSVDIFPKKPLLATPSQTDQAVNLLMVLLEDIGEFYMQIFDDQTEFFLQEDQKLKDICRSLDPKKLSKGFFH